MPFRLGKRAQLEFFFVRQTQKLHVLPHPATSAVCSSDIPRWLKPPLSEVGRSAGPSGPATVLLSCSRVRPSPSPSVSSAPPVSVSCLLSSVFCLLSSVFCLRSPDSCLLSPVFSPLDHWQ